MNIKNKASPTFPRYMTDHDTGLLGEDFFPKLLHAEIGRCERSGRPFLLMLLDLGSLHYVGAKKTRVLQRLARTLSSSTREIDVKGWLRYDSVIGIIFAEVGDGESKVEVAQSQISARLRKQLVLIVGESQLEETRISWYRFPDRFDQGIEKDPRRQDLDRALSTFQHDKRLPLRIKRMVDIAGSVIGIVVFAPLFLLIAASIKLTTQGPVLFKQERTGLGGKRFFMLKFRSMYIHNDPTAHREYVTSLINAGKNPMSTLNETGQQQQAFKIANDPRVTRMGRILRKTSLDELPQLYNVLKGDMSLVGPRPPVSYECEAYAIWHRGRLQSIKPGITGLWQVRGRSSVVFDDMVRMDIRYMREWSLWLDFKILLQTPLAVLSGKGAY
jgi:lipopolysaccharide/colanic/teichoic acid biosynthesis glycosyltransferase